jgi:hypothetical protein
MSFFRFAIVQAPLFAAAKVSKTIFVAYKLVMFEKIDNSLSSLVVHQVGNKLKEEGLVLSKSESGLDLPTLKIVQDYLASAFLHPEFYRFTHPADLKLNSVYSVLCDIFDSPTSFVAKSAQLAKLLYDVSDHPKVKSGELLVMFLENARAFGQEAPAIAIFKSEKKRPFLFTENQGDIIELFSYKGISPSKVDKAALIFNNDREDGFQVLSVDNINRGEEAKFWFDSFLKLEIRSSEFSKTTELIGLTKSFVDQDLQGSEVLDKYGASEYLERSKGYFEENERLAPDDYTEKVFEDPAVADRFREYVAQREPKSLNFEEEFEVSHEALKKKQSVFKSILKLDKNFHIYIHGKREWIEKGQDDDGRKFYKVYYEEEN